MAPALHPQTHVTTSVALRDDDGESTAAAVLEQVNRFARRSVDSRARRPEAPMDAMQVGALLEEARALGIVTGGEGEGPGVWSSVTGRQEVALSTRMLRRLAQSNAGFALAVHRTALAQWIVRRLGGAPAGHGTSAVQGRIGLGRLSLARYLAGEVMDEEGRATLADCYGAGEERLLTCHDAFEWVVAPVADPRGILAWAVWPRAHLSVRPLPNAHGFDELTTLAFRGEAASPPGLPAPADPAAGAECMSAALCMEALALMAIGLGAAEHGHAIARAYASARSQGGRPIEGHSAVQLLLASSRTAITTVEALIESAARFPMATAGLMGTFSARAEAHPLLCRAANDALQVFGGSGYMRDTGAEKIVRDLDHLRVISGSPPELSLFVAELERIHG